MSGDDFDRECRRNARLEEFGAASFETWRERFWTSSWDLFQHYDARDPFANQPMTDDPDHR